MHRWWSGNGWPVRGRLSGFAPTRGHNLDTSGTDPCTIGSVPDDPLKLEALLEQHRLGDLSDDELIARIKTLEERPADSLHSQDQTQPDAESEQRRAKLIARLDAYRAAERSGALTLGAWADLSDDAALVGGLRTAAAREDKHAALLEQRLVELGGNPTAEVPDSIARYNAAIVDAGATDIERLGLLIGRFPDIDEAIAPLTQFIDSIEDDELTQELLRSICVDELATLRWAHDAYLSRRRDDQ